MRHMAPMGVSPEIHLVRLNCRVEGETEWSQRMRNFRFSIEGFGLYSAGSCDFLDFLPCLPPSLSSFHPSTIEEMDWRGLRLRLQIPVRMLLQWFRN